MSRAIFLSSGGDPFLTLFVLKLFKERFYDEVDKFYINYNNHAGVPIEVASELVSLVVKDPKVQLIYHPNGIGNGMPITEMVKIAKEDYIMLLEDDGFIFQPGAINKCFQKIESDLTDIVGSLRFSCGTEIGEASKIKYGLDYSGYGDVGCNWWPNFFFCKREDLLKTDLDFGSHTFKPGDYSDELNYTFKDINHGDTFVWACIQLRALGLRSHSIPQHHASPFEITDKETKEQNWHQTQEWFPWIHGGSLSAGWGGYLSGSIPDTSNDSAKQEIETRVAFWDIVSADGIRPEGFEDFRREYRAGIRELKDKAGLDNNRIEKKIQIYRELLNV